MPTSGLYTATETEVGAVRRATGRRDGIDALVRERLAYVDERVTRTRLGDLRESAGGSDPDSTQYSDLSVLVVRRDG
jgi:cobalt-precorrin-7 (C5)-methyltransferase